jgi:hypothetical protein
MATDLMTRCETKRLFKVNGVKETRWVDVAVADILGGDAPVIRCTYCHGAVKVTPANDARGVEAHVKHRARTDADNCQGGKGQGRSSKPVS